MKRSIKGFRMQKIFDVGPTIYQPSRPHKGMRCTLINNETVAWTIEGTNSNLSFSAPTPKLKQAAATKVLSQPDFNVQPVLFI